MRIAAATDCDLERVVRGIQRGYEGFFMPVSFTRESFELAATRNDARLDLSPLALDGAGEIAGFAIIALRDERAYLWTIGIVAEHRRQGLASRLLDLAIRNAGAAGAQVMELEVLLQNEAARNLYHRAGFQIMEELIGLEREAEARVHAPLELRWSAAADVLPYLADQPPHERCWQRQRATVARMHELLAVSRPLAPQVHAFYTYGERELRLADWAVEDLEDARALTLAMVGEFPELKLILPNERASAISDRLPELGWREVWRQYRMFRVLS